MAEAEKTASDLGKAYYAASESMKDDMHRIFGNFQRAFEISEAEANRIFASVGNESAMKTLRAAAGKITDPEQRQLALDALTSAPAYTWRIARLDDMLGNVSQTCNRLYKTDLKKTTDFLGEIAGTAYNRTVYDLQFGTGTVGAAFDLLPESRINQILKTNWSGRNYSARIYADVKDMETKLKQTLLESMFTGESEHKIAEKVADRWQIGYNDARRLIRTETNYVSNQAELESYRSAGVKEYTFVAVLDSRTSEICAELDGKKFPVDRAKVGVNLPPMHPYCRSTTIAVIEDDIWEMSDEEIRKILDETDEELGLNEDIPFDDWLAGLKEIEDGKVKYVGVDKSAESGIIDLYKGKGLKVIPDSEINPKTIEIVNEATKKVTSDFKILERYSEAIRFSDVVGGLAENVYRPDTGLNVISLDKRSFSNPLELLEILKKDFVSGKSYQTDTIQSLVAHEMGHNAHVALALKRAKLDYGKPLSQIEIFSFNEQYHKISEDVYIAAFEDESLQEIYEQCRNELGFMTEGNARELIAQSFGNYYFGVTKSEIAKMIVKYFKKELK